MLTAHKRYTRARFSTCSKLFCIENELAYASGLYYHQAKVEVSYEIETNRQYDPMGFLSKPARLRRCPGTEPQNLSESLPEKRLAK